MKEVYVNNAGHELIVVRRLQGKKCIVQFTNTGFVKTAYIDNVRAGKCRDPYEVTKYGCGYLGEPNKGLPYYFPAHQLWSNMMKRCYSTKDPRGYYHKGTKVDKRWLCFANFIEDIPKLSGFKQWLNGGMNLDKDFIIQGNNVYSREACCFLPDSVNKSMGGINRQGKN